MIRIADRLAAHSLAGDYYPSRIEFSADRKGVKSFGWVIDSKLGIRLRALAAVQDEVDVLDLPPVDMVQRLVREKEEQEFQDEVSAVTVGVNARFIPTLVKTMMLFSKKLIGTAFGWAYRGGLFLGRAAIRVLTRAVLMPVAGAVIGVIGLPATIAIGVASTITYIAYKMIGRGGSLDIASLRSSVFGLGPTERGIAGTAGTEAGSARGAYSRTAPPGQTVARPGRYDPAATAERMALKVTDDAAAAERGEKILESKRSEDVRAAIAEASRVTGVSEAILSAFAYKESTFNPLAKAPTSSARGLFQFINKTWDSMISRYGARYGLDSTANRFVARDSAIMAGAFIKHEIYPSISRVVGEPNATDLYFGHFMGPAGGAKWLRIYKEHPNRYAAPDFPAAARSNKWVYWDKRGKPRTYHEIYQFFSKGLTIIEAAVAKETRAQTTEQPVAEANGNQGQPNQQFVVINGNLVAAPG